MTKYREIRGTLIQNVSADPPATFEGQVWYNTTTNKLRVRTSGLVGAWATANTLNTGRFQLAGAGTQTAALAFGGSNPPNPSPPPSTLIIGNTESYNGTNWTEVNDLNTARPSAGAGTQTSALAVGTGGIGSTNVESWNGTNWTEVNDLTTGDSREAVGESNTSALAIGGGFLGPRGTTESWNGTNWTEVNDMNIGKIQHSAAGTQTAALAFAGEDPTSPSTQGIKTESWNGTNWTNVADLSNKRYQSAGAGTSTSALVFGTLFSGGEKTESWNGTSWSELADLNTGRYNLAGAGANNTLALAFGGSPPSPRALTEEWSESPGIGNFDVTSS